LQPTSSGSARHHRLGTDQWRNLVTTEEKGALDDGMSITLRSGSTCGASNGIDGVDLRRHH